MSFRTALQSALESRVSNGTEAYEVTDQMFDRVISVVRQRCPGMSLVEAELMLADLKRDVGNILFDLTHNTLDADDAVDVITRVLRED
jgi:hypothetical protein